MEIPMSKTSSVVLLILIIQSVYSHKSSFPPQYEDYSWDHYDKQVRKMSETLGKQNQSFTKSKLIKVELEGKEVKFLYDSGAPEWQEVIFHIQDKGAITLQSWKSVPMPTSQQEKIVHKLEVPRTTQSLPNFLAKNDDYNPRKIKIKSQDSSSPVFKSLSAQQIKKDKNIYILKQHIYNNTDIDLLRTQIKNIQRKVIKDGYFYKCKFETFKKSHPASGPYNFTIIVFIDKDPQKIPKTIEEEYRQGSQLKEQVLDQSKDIVTNKQIKKEGGKQNHKAVTALPSKCIQIDIESPVFNELFKLQQEAEKKQQQIKHSQKLPNSLMQTRKVKLKTIFSNQDTNKQLDGNNYLSAEQKLCLLFNKQGGCMSCTFRSIPIGAKCFQVKKQCEKFNKTTGKCLKCYEGYYLKEGVCKKNHQFCSTSDFQGKCTACYPNYDLVEGVCLITKPGVSRHLVRSDPLCRRMQNGQCLQCRAGTRLNKTRKCEINDPLCQKYNESSQKCQQCLRGYKLQNNKCLKSH